jgi:hypothetical protein
MVKHQEPQWEFKYGPPKSLMTQGIAQGNDLTSKGIDNGLMLLKLEHLF